MEKISISNDSHWYEAWPDLVLCEDGHLLCVFSECTHHDNRAYTRIMLTDSFDGGKTWTKKRPLTEGTTNCDYFYNCARISKFRSGELAITIDRVPKATWESDLDRPVIYSCRSTDNGQTWGQLEQLPMHGIVPDRLLELQSGRLMLTAHRRLNGRLAVYTRFSDDNGKTWSSERLLAGDSRYELCEASLLHMGGGAIVAFLRENSLQGIDCLKVISHDNGETWSPVFSFPLSGCHRPTAGFLRDGRIFITYRYMPGKESQSFCCALTDRSSVLATNRDSARARIFPLDYDRAERQDTGYSGWAELDDGEIFIVNYIVDDALNHGQIRGYRLNIEELFMRKREHVVEKSHSHPTEIWRN